MTCTAYEAITEDVVAVLRRNATRVANSAGLPFDVMAEQIIGALDCASIENAALDAGVDIEVQTRAACEEIEAQLVRMGVLEAARTTGRTTARYRIHSRTMALQGCGYWSNDIGWVDLDAADTFSAAERVAFDTRLPFDPPDAQWLAC